MGVSPDFCSFNLQGGIIDPSRLHLGFGRDGPLPSIFAKVHPTRHTPIHSQILVGCVVAVMGRLFNVHMLHKLNAARQELTGQAQMLSQDLSRSAAVDVQQAPAIKAEIEYMKQELHQATQAIEYEKKGYAENYEQGQGMEKNLISMACEVEKLRAEIANAEKRARAAAAVGNQGIVGRISPKTWAAMEIFMSSFAAEDYEAMVSALIEMGATEDNVDSKAFAKDLRKVFSSIQELDTEIVVATARGSNAAAVSTNVVVDENQMNVLFLDLGVSKGGSKEDLIVHG